MADFKITDKDPKPTPSGTDAFLTEDSSGDYNYTTYDQIKTELSYKDLPNVPESLAIDGDFNHWSAYTGAVSTDGYASDVWKLNVFSGSGQLERVPHDQTNSKPYYIRITSSNGAFVGIDQNKERNYLSGKKINVFIRCKSTDAPSNLIVQIKADGSGTNYANIISQTNSIGSDFSWIRYEIEVGNYSVVNYTSFLIINNNSSETFNLDIDKIRVYDTFTTGYIPAGEIPSWIDADEDVLVQQAKVKAYYQILDAGSLTVPFADGAGFSSTQCRMKYNSPVEMVQVPSISFSTALPTGQILLRGNGAGSQVTSISSVQKTGATINFYANTASGIAVNYAYSLAVGGQKMIFDARY